jgi:hypothetical protein
VRNLRNVDTVFRAGPFRFAALLPETPPDGAAAAAQRVETRVPDIAVSCSLPVRTGIRSTGWAEGEVPSVDDVLAEIEGRHSAA